MKLYAKKATATAIATKLSKAGKAHEVTEVDGQFRVSLIGAASQEASSVSDLVAEVIFGADSKAGAGETVAVMIPGARLTAGYVITPPLGQSKKGPVERWFDRKRLKNAFAVEGGVQMTLTRAGLVARKIVPEDFLISA